MFNNISGKRANRYVNVINMEFPDLNGDRVIIFIFKKLSFIEAAKGHHEENLTPTSTGYAAFIKFVNASANRCAAAINSSPVSS